jgi:hypothetical protein
LDWGNSDEKGSCNTFSNVDVASLSERKALLWFIHAYWVDFLSPARQVMRKDRFQPGIEPIIPVHDTEWKVFTSLTYIFLNPVEIRRARCN